MLSTITSTFAGRRLPVAAFLTLLVLAGCGGGGGGGGGEQGGGNGEGGGGGNGETQASEKEKGPKIPAGSQVRNLAVRVTSPTQATITATLAKPAELALIVRRTEGSKEENRVGRVEFPGRKPQGAVTIPWNLKVENKSLAAGEYEVQLRGKDTGRSKPTTFTVPGG